LSHDPISTRLARRQALRQMGRLVMLLTVPAGARAALSAAGAANPASPASATIVAVRVWPARDYTRVTIESDQALKAAHLLAHAPHRLMVDLNRQESELRELVGKIRPDDPSLPAFVGQFLPRVVHLVLT
jgi:N-acetylmuramoyl-L-alanine amidase